MCVYLAAYATNVLQAYYAEQTEKYGMIFGEYIDFCCEMSEAENEEQTEDYLISAIEAFYKGIGF